METGCKANLLRKGYEDYGKDNRYKIANFAKKLH